MVRNNLGLAYDSTLFIQSLHKFLLPGACLQANSGASCLTVYALLASKQAPTGQNLTRGESQNQNKIFISPDKSCGEICFQAVINAIIGFTYPLIMGQQ
jgi:hypothetical protein